MGLFAARSGGAAMSLFRRPSSPFWWYDFQFNGRQFRRSTKTESEHEARVIEREARLHAKHGLWDKLNSRKKHTPLAAMNKCLAQRNKNRTAKANKRQEKPAVFGSCQTG